MADNATTKVKAPKPESTPRKIRTEAERIADLEAKLKAARAKAEAKANKQVTVLKDKRAALVARWDKLNAEIDAIDAQLLAMPVAEG